MKISQSEFKEIYFNYFKALCVVSYRCLNDMDKAQDIVQQVFLDLLENIESKKIDGEIYSYLKKAVYFKSIDWIRKEQLQSKYLESLQSDSYKTQMENLFDRAELERTIYEIVDHMPQQRRTIFIKSRNEGKTNKEIAAELNISVRTVETQLFRGLKELKKKLKHYLLNLIFLFF